jgi:hypothetical protein
MFVLVHGSACGQAESFALPLPSSHDKAQTPLSLKHTKSASHGPLGDWQKFEPPVH